MKQKRTIILISIFAVIACIMVVFSTVFSLAKIEVDFINTSAFDEKEIISNSALKKGNSIFALNKEKSRLALESKFAKGKFSLEIKFPNKVVIHVNERFGLLSIKNDSNYYVLDSELKIISIENSAPVGLISSNSKINKNLAEVNDDLDLLKLINSFKKYGFNDTKMLEELNSISIENMEIVAGNETKVAVVKTNKKYNFYIDDITDSLDDKISNLVGLYNSDKLPVLSEVKEMYVTKSPANGDISITEKSNV